MRAHHVAISTAHFDRLRAFYVETLGLPAVGGFPEHQILFLDAGGLTLELARRYLDLPHVPVCGGSWLAPAEALLAGDWPRITLLARETLRVLRPQGQTG